MYVYGGSQIKSGYCTYMGQPGKGQQYMGKPGKGQPGKFSRGLAASVLEILLLVSHITIKVAN